jgi:hypothetical protein
MTLATTIQYTPFVETSFGYGTTELNTWFTNPTDVVKVRIDGFSGFDRTTGHISTPSVGTAVSTFNTHNYVWQVVGERDDVNAVLSKLKYFPQDYEDARIWSPIRTKTNVISGAYGSSEEPPAIPDVSFRIKVYDANDVLDGRDYSIIAEAINTGYGNQRPYWSTEPAVQDCSSLGIPPYIDLGTINHGSDTENVNVKCEFRNYGSSSTYTGGAYGQFTLPARFYIGDKKEGDINSTDARFNFTGSVIDTQAFLDNIGYNRPTVGDTFDMFLTIDDGVTSSTLTKTCWFADTPFTTSHAMPDLTGTEETTITGLNQDASWTINHAAEVNQFYYVITLDPTGTDGVENILSTVGAGTFSNGVYTSINCVSPEALVLRMNNTQFELKDDFNDNFTYTIQFFGFNSTIGSSYSSAIENVNVVMTGTEEIANATSSHNWTEDTSYNLNTETVVQINHGYDRDFECRLQISDTNAGVLSATASGSGTATWTSPNLLFVGTRDEVNAMLQTTKFTPTVDYASNFTLSYYQKRVSGETTSDTDDVYNIEIGLANTITMNVIAHDEFSITQPSAIAWEENVSKIFDSGLQITDLADENIDLATYQTDYRIELAMWNNATEVTYGTLVANTTTGLTVGGVGNQNGQGDTNMISYTGSKTDINAALADLKFIPNVDYYGQGPEVYYKIIRVQDGLVLTNQAQTTKTTFLTATDNVGFANSQPTINWDWNTLVDFDSGLSITDNATDNDDYTHHDTNFTATIRAKYFDGTNSQALTTATFTSTSYGSATVSGSGTVSDPLIITGLKADVNTALANMRMTPDIDWSDSPATDGSFWIESKLERLHDSVISLNFTPVTTNFNAGTQTVGVNNAWGQINYDENIPLQSLFSSITTVTEELDQYYANVTYETEVTLGSGISTGFMSPRYGDDDYVTPNNIQTIGSDDPNDNYVNDFSIKSVGTRTVVNAIIQALQFTPYLDSTNSSNIQLTVKRYINGVLSKTFLNYFNVGDINGQPAPDFSYGTANNNIQYFVSDKNFSGIANPTTVNYNLSNAVYEDLTPKQIALNKGYVYDRPITITDTYEQGGGASQYKIVMSSWSSGVILQYNSSYMDKESLHTMLDNGIHQLGGNFSYSNNTTKTVSFTLHRRTYDGEENQFAQGILTYKYVSGHKLRMGANTYFPSFSMVQDSNTLYIRNDDRTQAADGLNYAFEYLGYTYSGGSGTQSAGNYIPKSSGYPPGRWYGSGAGLLEVRHGDSDFDGEGDFNEPYFYIKGLTIPSLEPYGDPVNQYGRHISIVVWNNDGIITRFGSQDLFTGSRIITYRS